MTSTPPEKRAMIAATEKDKEANAYSSKKVSCGKIEAMGYPVLPLFSCGIKNATALLDRLSMVIPLS